MYVYRIIERKNREAYESLATHRRLVELFWLCIFSCGEAKCPPENIALWRELNASFVH